MVVVVVSDQHGTAVSEHAPPDHPQATRALKSAIAHPWQLPIFSPAPAQVTKQIDRAGAQGPRARWTWFSCAALAKMLHRALGNLTWAPRRKNLKVGSPTQAGEAESIPLMTWRWRQAKEI